MKEEPIVAVVHPPRVGGRVRSRVEKTCQRLQLRWGPFFMAGEHFRPKFTPFCRIFRNLSKITHF